MRIFKNYHLFFLTCILCLVAGKTTAAELLLVEQPDCPYCDKFHAEIAPAYPNTAEGKIAPLKIVQLADPLPERYKNITPATVTPTFILVDGNNEIDRIVGYPGDEFFWFLLAEMLAKIDP